MVKKVYPIKWDAESGKWLLQYLTTGGNVQKVLSPERAALENYLCELQNFKQSFGQKSH